MVYFGENHSSQTIICFGIPNSKTCKQFYTEDVGIVFKVCDIIFLESLDLTSSLETLTTPNPMSCRNTGKYASLKTFFKQKIFFFYLTENILILIL